MTQRTGMSITIEGIPETVGFLEKKQSAFTAAAEDALKESAAYLTSEVKESIAGRRAEPASVDLGNFLQSVSFTANGMEATVYSDVEYAQYLEYGTSKMNARSHFRNSAARSEPKIKDFIAKELARAAR